MIQKIVSKRVELPTIYLIENEDDFKELATGLPYIVADKEDLDFVTTFLEFQVLFRSCKRTGVLVNWLDCLKRIGFGTNIKEYTISSGGDYWHGDKGSAVVTMDNFIQDRYFVDFDKLTELKILPSWMEDLRAAVETNIIDEVNFNPIAFNKKLGTNTGAAQVKSNKKNLLILDISGSIPDAIRISIIQLSRLMSKRFYADVIFTGGQTVFLDYEEMMTADVKKITDGISRNNEGAMYKAIVEQHRVYGTCFCFGDNDSPAQFGDGKELQPNFQIETLYSLHTDCKSDNVTGYGRYFKPTNTIKVKDWVNTISK